MLMSAPFGTIPIVIQLRQGKLPEAPMGFLSLTNHTWRPSHLMYDAYSETKCCCNMHAYDTMTKFIEHTY